MPAPSTPRSILKQRISSSSPNRHAGETRDTPSGPCTPQKKVKFPHDELLVQAFDAIPSEEYDRTNIEVSERANGFRRHMSVLDHPPSWMHSPLLLVLSQSSPVIDEGEEDDVSVMSSNYSGSTTPPLVLDNISESEESDIPSPTMNRRSSWPTDNLVCDPAIGTSPSTATEAVLSTRSPRYPAGLSLSSSQPAAFHKRPRLMARRHRVPAEFQQGSSGKQEDAIMGQDMDGVTHQVESWVLSSNHDDEGVLGGF